MRLNGWQRIGIVASVIWAIGGGILGYRIGYGVGAPHTEFICPDQACWEARYAEMIRYQWHFAAAFALIPIPVGWFVIWGLAAVRRWIEAGFKRESNSD